MRRHITFPDIPAWGCPAVGAAALIVGQAGHILYAVLLAVPAAVLFVWGCAGTRVYWR